MSREDESRMGVMKMSRKEESQRGGLQKEKNSGAYVMDIPKGVIN